MKKQYFPKINQFLMCLVLFEICVSTSSSNAFFPKINEPNTQELESTSIKIGKTAIQLIQFGQNHEAIKLLKLAVKLNPKENDLWTSLAEAQFRVNKKYQAISSLSKAIQINPKEQSIYFRKGSIYMDLNEPQKAKFAIKKGLLINEKNERGYFQLGNTEIMLNNYKSALIAFKRSSRINSNFWQSINNEGLVLYELNDLKEAILKFKSALKISNDAEPMLALAVALFASDNKSYESFILAKKALEFNPKYVSQEYQTQQLWGKKLQKSAQLLFQMQEMKKVVKTAKEKSQ
ncbi:tetratricopeptide repeat protein [Prochlorococcus marinus]|uniref:tetratricopeptide repeat protein n=1 Tax=Prochlorococcus marinus TaxID=1219 RepID=UPI0022B323A7|nr:tetratricopeptide repeat protein [Prochlorococcus marinus]